MAFSVVGLYVGADVSGKDAICAEGETMTLRQFIKENRQALDEIIQGLAPGSSKSDSERELWVLNDEDLYNWARSEGVRI